MRYSLLIAFVLMACQPEDPVKPTVTSSSDGCGASHAQGWVGQSSEILARMKFHPDTTRIIHPGDAVTLDFREDRLNIEIDANGMISRVYCG